MRARSSSAVSRIALILGGFLFALALQSLAFTEPSSNPPAGDVSAPINTGPTSQDKSGGGSAWITADGLGSRYGALLATVSGNVGIGTTSPQYPLDIQMNGATPVVALRANNNADLQWYRNGAGSGTYMWDLSNRGTNSSPSDNLQLYTNGSNPIMTWQQNGNVGIGTTNPTALFQVYNASSTQWAGYFQGSQYGIYANSGGNSWAGDFQGGGSYGLYSANASGYYTQLDNGGWSVYANGSEYLGGNLQVAGTISAGGTVIYSCPEEYNTSCQGQLQTGSQCQNYVNGSWGPCTPVGHLVQ